MEDTIETLSGKTMREVVQHLRAQKSQSVEELLALSDALHHILLHLLSVAHLARELDVRLLAVKPPKDAYDAERIKEIQGNARAVSDGSDQVFTALREVQAAIVDWRIAGPTLVPAERGDAERGDVEQSST